MICVIYIYIYIIYIWCRPICSLLKDYHWRGTVATSLCCANFNNSGVNAKSFYSTPIPTINKEGKEAYYFVGQPLIWRNTTHVFRANQIHANIHYFCRYNHPVTSHPLYQQDRPFTTVVAIQNFSQRNLLNHPWCSIFGFH